MSPVTPTIAAQAIVVMVALVLFVAWAERRRDDD